MDSLHVAISNLRLCAIVGQRRQPRPSSARITPAIPGQSHKFAIGRITNVARGAPLNPGQPDPVRRKNMYQSFKDVLIGSFEIARQFLSVSLAAASIRRWLPRRYSRNEDEECQR